MLLAVWPVASGLPPLAALLLGPPLGVAVYLAGLKITRALTFEDYNRLTTVSEQLPGGARKLSGVVLRSLTSHTAAAAAQL
jgi:hypothetical protein